MCKRNHQWRVLIPILIMVLGWLCFAGCAFQNEAPFMLHLIDVAQGDSQLLVTPEGSTILIDAGDPLQGDRVVAYLRREGLKEIDHFILTHPHSDHIGGALSVLQEFPVNHVYLPPVTHTTQLYEKILMYLHHQHINTTFVRQTASILEENQLVVKIISSGYDFGNNLNNWSLITHVSYRNQSFLFMGDAESEGEEALLDHMPPRDIKATVLKVGHHGSNTSTTPRFINAVSPEVALISCGENNPYFHPHPDLLQRLEEANVWIYRTDLQGSTVLFSDGYQVYSHSEPSNHLSFSPTTEMGPQVLDLLE